MAGHPIVCPCCPTEFLLMSCRRSLPILVQFCSPTTYHPDASSRSTHCVGITPRMYGLTWSSCTCSAAAAVNSLHHQAVGSSHSRHCAQPASTAPVQSYRAPSCDSSQASRAAATSADTSRARVIVALLRARRSAADDSTTPPRLASASTVCSPAPDASTSAVCDHARQP